MILMGCTPKWLVSCKRAQPRGCDKIFVENEAERVLRAKRSSFQIVARHGATPILRRLSSRGGHHHHSKMLAIPAKVRAHGAPLPAAKAHAVERSLARSRSCRTTRSLTGRAHSTSMSSASTRRRRRSSTRSSSLRSPTCARRPSARRRAPTAAAPSRPSAAR